MNLTLVKLFGWSTSSSSVSDSSLPPLIDFYKLACGSIDFLLWDLTDSLSPPNFVDFKLAADLMCPRRTGVGATGLIVLLGSNSFVEPHLFRPGHVDDLPSYQALLCVAKYLLDGAKFGKTTFHFPLRGEEVRVYPIDSLSMAIDLDLPRCQNHVLRNLEDLQHREFQSLGFTLKSFPLNLAHQQAHFFFQTNVGLSRLSRWKRAVFRTVGQGYLPVTLQLASPHQINIEYPTTEDEPDLVILSAMAFQLAYVNGLIDQDVVMRHGNHPYFVSLQTNVEKIRVMVPIRYVFRGNYSFSEYLF